MNWIALEAISSAIGAIGVIITIAYLAYQIRQNTHSIEGATEQSLMSLEKDVYVLIADNAAIFRKGSTDFDALNPDEAVQYANIVSANMSLLYSAYVQHKRKLISDEVWDAYKRDIVFQFQSPGYLAAWLTFKNSYPLSFTEVMENVEREAMGNS